MFFTQTHVLVVLLKRKYCLRFVYGQKFYYQLRILTSQCSAQNLAHLGSKATNRRRDSLPSGHDQRSRCQIFRTCIVCLLQRYWSFTKKLCYLLFSISVAIGQFSSNWPGWSSRTVIRVSAFCKSFVTRLSTSFPILYGYSTSPLS